MRYKNYDKAFLIIVLVLVIFGVFALASASFGLTSENRSLLNILSRQLLLGLGAGSILAFITSRIPYQCWQRFALVLFLVSFFLNILVFEPNIGFSYGGASRWLNFGHFFFQPSELLKFAFVVYLASWLVSRKSDAASFQFGFLPFLVMTGLIGALLVFEPDIGTLGVISLSSALIFFIGGGRLSQLGILLFLGIVILAALIFFEPYRMSRVLVFFNPSFDPGGAGYQARQALIAMGSGGLFGRGFGMSKQKFGFLPEPVGDSIFAVIAEEFGFLGIIFLVGAFMALMWRGFYIAKRAPDLFGRLLGSGIVILIMVQSLVNMAAISGMLPLTGIPLLFISQGSSALLITLVEVGVLLNISRAIS